MKNFPPTDFLYNAPPPLPAGNSGNNRRDSGVMNLIYRDRRVQASNCQLCSPLREEITLDRKFVSIGTELKYDVNMRAKKKYK